MDMGRGEERVRCMESVTWKLTICKTDSQQEFAVCLRKLKQGLCVNLEGWERREVQEGGDICLFQFWFPQSICLGVRLLGHMVVLFLVF